MTDEKQEQNIQPDKTQTAEPRRSAVKKIVLASGVITTSQLADTRWAKPVVESVVLPAHAQTTTPTTPTTPDDAGGY